MTRRRTTRKPSAPVRASEIGEYLFCAQAWWFRQQGIPPANRARLQAGWSAHREHGRRVAFWTRWRRGAAVLFWVSLALALLVLVWNLLG